MSLPDKGTFKIETIGPMKEIPNKKDPNRPWKTYSLQFEGDPNWYDTFWTRDTAPEIGEELTGTKDEHEKFGLQFAMDRPGGGRSNWNPAAAQATIMGSAVQLVNGFLALGNNYQLWDENDKEIKKKFEKYINTVDSVAKQLKDRVVAMGSLKPEEKVSESTSAPADGAGTPPPIDGWPEDEEEVEV